MTMLSVLRLFSPSIVAGLWAVASAFGLQGPVVRTVGLTALSITLAVSTIEIKLRARRRGDNAPRH